MKIAGKVKEFFHNEGIHSTTIQPEFVEIENLYTNTGESQDLYQMCLHLLFFWNNFLEIASIGFFFENLTMIFFYLDGLSTYLNVNGSQDGCALDCPTTEEGCVKQTCCQTNNNKVCTNDNCPNIF